MRSVRTVLVALASAIAGAVLFAGCDGGSPDDRIVRTTASRPAALPDGRLKSQPSPLTLAEVSRQPRNSPQRVVMEMVFFAQWGSLPNVRTAYGPEVLRRVSLTDMYGAYALQRASLVAALPRIKDVTTTKTGRFVAVRFSSATSPPVDDSFLLRRVDGGWKIVYDSLLDRALSQYVQTRVDPSLEPSRRAKAAGNAASDRFRAASGPSLGLIE